MKNVGDLQNFYHGNSYLLKNASLIFKKNGTLETKLRSSSDANTWVAENGTWAMPKEGGAPNIK